MSRTTTESKDGVFCNDQIESPLMDEGNSGGSDGLILKKGPWTSAEDAILMDYVKKHGEGNWNAVQKHSGLFRCGKSCRLRWANHLRPNLKKGAFTQEEEQLIIELHAKMGNKWARMAAHLPGRTDNEIKNYWNTRIKRRQRAGLPLYPPELSLQAVHESLHGQNTSDIDAGDRGQQGLFQSNSYEIPDVIFDGLKVNQGALPYVPEIPDISSTNMLMEHLSSPQYCTFAPPTLHRQKRIRESTSMFSDYSDSLRSGFPPFDQLRDDASDINAQSCGLSFPVDPDDTNKNSLSFGVIQGSHSLSNGNFSASKPTSEAVKLELPSLQYSETALSSWGLSSPPPALDSVDTFIQSPPSGTFGADCLSPRNSGLLDALLHEAKTLSSAKNHSSDKSSNSSSATPADDADSSNLNISETEWEEYGGPISPLGHSATSLFTECTPLSASGSSLDEQPVENFTGLQYDGYVVDSSAGTDMKPEPVDESWPSDRQKEATTTHLDSSRPDALLGSDWFGQKACCADDQAIMSDAIATLLGDDLGSDYMHITTGTSSASQGWGFGSCTWNNKPAVCHLSEIP